jgi:hypothetical protein
MSCPPATDPIAGPTRAALAADAADHPFGEGVLPGTPRGGEDFLDAHARDALLERQAVDAVSIPDQVARHQLPDSQLGELPDDPR